MPERPKYLDEWDKLACNPYCPALRRVESSFVDSKAAIRPTAEDSNELIYEAENHLNHNKCDVVVGGVCELDDFLVRRAIELQAEKRKSERQTVIKMLKG